MGLVSVAVLVVLVASPSLLGERVEDGIAGLGEATPAWLWAAAAFFLAMHACTGVAWSVALRACGTATDHGDAIARYGIGSALNAFGPMRVGTAARFVLFARLVGREGSLWTVGGASAAVGAVRTIWFSLLVAGAAIAGVVPAWPLAACVGSLVVAGGAVAVSRRHRFRARLAHVLDAFAAFGRCPRTVVTVGALTLASLTAKIAASAAIAAALGVEQPLLIALVIVPAVELAAALPLTPGNVGLTSAAVAFAVGMQGVDSASSLSVGIAFGAVDLLAAAGIGAAGALVLAGPLFRPMIRFAAVGAGSAAVATAFAVTVVLPVA